MTGRVYSVPFKAINIGTVVSDLWAITTASNMPVDIEDVRLDPCATAISDLLVSFHLFTGAFTAGAGGSAVTPVPRVYGDTAAVTSAKVLNTTQTAAGSGVNTVTDAGEWNLVNGWAWQPLDTDHRITIPVSSCFVVSLDSAGASETVSGCLILREFA